MYAYCEMLDIPYLNVLFHKYEERARSTVLSCWMPIACTMDNQMPTGALTASGRKMNVMHRQQRPLAVAN
jgi:hypothetical protein